MSVLPAILLLWYCLRQRRRSSPRWQRTKTLFVLLAAAWLILPLLQLLWLWWA